MVKVEKVTTVLQMNKKQEQLQFVNIETSGADNRLFLDPLLIAINKDKFSKAAHTLLTDYFQTVFKLIREGKSIEGMLLGILGNSSENNSFRLGKSEFIKDVYPNGKGCGPNMLYKLLTRVEHRRLIEDGTIKGPMDVVLFIKNFNEDRMSDLLASILFGLLSEFTVTQALKYNPNAKFRIQEGLRWDVTIHNWVKFQYRQLLDLNEIPLTLIPKHIVTDQYRYRADNYLMAHLIQYEQEEELKVALKTNPDAVKRNKKLISSEKKEELSNPSTKDLIIQLTLAHRSKNPVNVYKENIAKKYNGGLSDSQLTSIIEKPYAEIAKGVA
ncbi:hypothetical protein [Sporosarcina limicola]|uniref:Uncharacterized protein n=1 Tax=Sporosarcina limicola TaxID=34101 RepID=A0A927MQJ9_9BACL|nr:hypothetical protein [Sporosarcina limicola]MBE1557142.1 hypothetical protein [Sporosarcina limicola]